MSTNPNNSTPSAERVAARWESMPKGWTDKSRKKFWDTMTGDVKHKVTKCIKEMDGKVGDPGAFCASLADRVEPGWRSKKGGIDVRETLENGDWPGRGNFDWSYVENEGGGRIRFDWKGGSMWVDNGWAEGQIPRHIKPYLKKLRFKMGGKKAEVRAGQKFVLVDTITRGGRWIDDVIYDSSRDADRMAAKLRKRQPKGARESHPYDAGIQVMDAMWFEPARSKMKAMGMVASATKTASTNTERDFYKASDGNWYVDNEDYEEDEDGEQIEGDTTSYGPFPSFEAADKYMDRNFANSGGSGEDDSGRQRPPRNPVSPRQSRRWACCGNCADPAKRHAPCGTQPLSNQPDYGAGDAALPRAAASTLSSAAKAINQIGFHRGASLKVLNRYDHVQDGGVDLAHPSLRGWYYNVGESGSGSKPWSVTLYGKGTEQEWLGYFGSARDATEAAEAHAETGRLASPTRVADAYRMSTGGF